jgi:hypothetical protein
MTGKKSIDLVNVFCRQSIIGIDSVDVLSAIGDYLCFLPLGGGALAVMTSGLKWSGSSRPREKPIRRKTATTRCFGDIKKRSSEISAGWFGRC